MGKFPNILLAMYLLSLAAGPAYAHGDHDEPERHEAGPAVVAGAVVAGAGVAEHFPGATARYASRHFVVLHDAAPAQAKVRAALLETTRRSFHRSFRRLGMDLAMPAQPLLCVLFTDRESYAAYSRQVDGTDMGWTTGYYSGRTNRIVLLDESIALADAPTSAQATAELARYGEQAEQIVLGALDPSAFDGPWQGLASTTHEAAHQLAFNTGVQKRGVMYPLWVSEGLASAFETENPSEPFGPGHVNVRRQRDLHRALDEDRLLPLHRFVVGVRVPRDDPRFASALYAQAWSLFQYLYLERPRELGGYLTMLADLPPGRRTETQRRREFVEAFGPIEQVEAAWREHVETGRGEN